VPSWLASPSAVVEAEVAVAEVLVGAGAIAGAEAGARFFCPFFISTAA